VIDAEGRFVPQNFENLFSKYDKTGTGSLSLRELFDMMHGHRCAVDPFGVGATTLPYCFAGTDLVSGVPQSSSGAQPGC